MPRQFSERILPGFSNVKYPRRAAENPLEIEYILHYILQYVPETSELLSARLVNKLWNNTIVRILNHPERLRRVIVALDYDNIHHYMLICKEVLTQQQQQQLQTCAAFRSLNLKINFATNLHSNNSYYEHYLEKVKQAALVLLSPPNPETTSSANVTKISCYLKSFNDPEFLQLLTMSATSLEKIEFNGCCSGNLEKSIAVSLPCLDDGNSASTTFPNMSRIVVELHSPVFHSKDLHHNSHVPVLELIKGAPALEKLIISERRMRYAIDADEQALDATTEANVYFKGQFVSNVLAGFNHGQLKWSLPISVLELPIYDQLILNAFIGLDLPTLNTVIIQQHLIVMLSTGFVSFLAKCTKLNQLDLYFMVPDAVMKTPEDLLQEPSPQINSIKRIGYFIGSFAEQHNETHVCEALTTTLAVISRRFPCIAFVAPNLIGVWELNKHLVWLKYTDRELPLHLPTYLIEGYRELTFSNVSLLNVYSKVKASGGGRVSHSNNDGDHHEDFDFDYVEACRSVLAELRPIHAIVYPAVTALLLSFEGAPAARLIEPWIWNL